LLLSCEQRAVLSGRHQATASRYDTLLHMHSWRMMQGQLIDGPADSFILSAPEKADSQYLYGFYTRFDSNGTFLSYYSAECGNDCFTSCYGRYYFADSDKIHLQLDSVTHSGECRSATDFPNEDLGDFRISTATNRLLLHKE